MEDKLDTLVNKDFFKKLKLGFKDFFKDIITDSRIKWVDIFRGILIIFVILSHQKGTPSIYYTFFNTFFLTGFFFVSGYLYKDRSLKEFIINRVFSLLIPWILLSIIEILVNRGLMVSIINDINNLKEPITNIIMGLSIWFLPCLFVTELYFIIITKIIKKENIRLIILILLSIVGLVIMTPGVKCFFHYDVALFMLLFYTIGYIYRKYETQIKEKICKNIVLIIAIIIYLVIRILDFVCLRTQIDLATSKIGNIPIYIISAILGILIVYIISNKGSARKNRILIFLGQNTLLYYPLHLKVMVTLDKVLLQLNLSDYIYCFVNTLLTIVILAIPVIFINKYIPILSGKYKLKKNNNIKDGITNYGKKRIKL